MRLSKRTEYGLRAVVQLARLAPKTYVQSRDLSKREALPNKFLEAILLALRQGGFLDSKVGAGGGYRLARDPKDISVGDLVRRLEGRLSIHDADTNADRTPGELAVQLINHRLTDATGAVLDEVTLDQLLEQVIKAGGLQQAMYYI